MRTELFERANAVRAELEAEEERLLAELAEVRRLLGRREWSDPAPAARPARRPHMVGVYGAVRRALRDQPGLTSLEYAAYLSQFPKSSVRSTLSTFRHRGWARAEGTPMRFYPLEAA